MSFRTWDRVICLLAVGFASSICVLNAPLANAARSPSGELGEGSAQQSVTVEDVQRMLAEDKGKPDAKVAQQLSGLKLTERMRSAKLKLLEQSVPGTKSRRALLALADASVFLSPAVADVLSQVPPDSDEQRHVLASTAEYLAKMLPKLPNFYATRTTVRYEEGMQSGKRARAASQKDSSWRQVGSSTAVVTYRDGKELVDPREWGKHPSHPKGVGLITRGTFGPILSTVIADAAHGEMAWDHWERGSARTLAVFRYRVPQNQSHYSLAIRGLSSDKGDAEQITAYDGEVAIDAASGTILFLTVQADQPLGSPIIRSDIMVEYGPVEIGGKAYTCPIRSVSIELDSGVFMGIYASAPTSHATLLNDVTFGDYHLFGSDARILTGNVPAPDH